MNAITVRAALDRAGFARDAAAVLGVSLRTASQVAAASSTAMRDVPEGAAHLVLVDAVVVGELEHGARLASSPKPTKASEYLCSGSVGLAQQLHAEHAGVEVDRALRGRRRAAWCGGFASWCSGQSSIISKSSLRAPHSGHVQFGGTSSQRVPGGDAFVRRTFGLVVDPAADEAHVFLQFGIPFR